MLNDNLAKQQDKTAYLTVREQNLYDCLQDDLSKRIFLRRVEFKKMIESTDGFSNSPENTFKISFTDFFERLPEYPCIQTENEYLNTIKKGRYIIYGYSAGGNRHYELSKYYGCVDNVVGIWDRNPALTGRAAGKLYVELPPKSLEGTPDFDFILIAVGNNSSFREIFAYLKNLGIDKSKILLAPYENEAQIYFDLDIIVPHLCDNEIFIDGGCLDFATSRRLLELNPNVKKIYAFEPDPESYNKVLSNIVKSGFPNAVVEPYAWWSSETELCFESNVTNSRICDNGETKVKTITIDSAVPDDENVTFIKLDVEGAEMEVLIGARETIKRCKPKLALSVYHKPNDFIDIPEFIRSLVPEYKIWFRHYHANYASTVAYFVV